MKTLISSLIILFSLQSLSAVGNIYDTQDRILDAAKNKKWEKIVNWSELNALSSEQKFRLASQLKNEGLISRKLFLETKHKPGLIQQRIKDPKTSQKEREIQRLALSLISDITQK